MILCLAAGALLAMGLWRSSPVLVGAGGAIGGVFFGHALFLPLNFTNQADRLDAAASLALCSSLIVIGAVVINAYGPPRTARPDGRASAVSLGSVLVGLVLVAAAIWVDVETGKSFWEFSSQGGPFLKQGAHAVGVGILLAVVATAILTLAAFYKRKPLLFDLAFAGAGVVCGLGTLLVVENKEALEAGAWLAAAGGLVVLLGSGALYLSAFRPRS